MHRSCAKNPDYSSVQLTAYECYRGPRNDHRTAMFPLIFIVCVRIKFTLVRSPLNLCALAQTHTLKLALICVGSIHAHSLVGTSPHWNKHSLVSSLAFSVCLSTTASSIAGYASPVTLHNRKLSTQK